MERKQFVLESGRSRYLVSPIPGPFQILHLTYSLYQFTDYPPLPGFSIFVLVAHNFDTLTLSVWFRICLPSPTRCALSTGCLLNAKNYTLPRRQASSPAPVVCQNSPLPDLSLTRHLHFCPKHGSLKTLLFSPCLHTLFSSAHALSD